MTDEARPRTDPWMDLDAALRDRIPSTERTALAVIERCGHDLRERCHVRVPGPPDAPRRRYPRPYA